jgi:antirestriction protein ArdC
MYLNCPSTDDVKDEIGFDHKNTIAIFSKFGMSRYSSEERIMFKASNAIIEPVDKGDCSTRTIFCNEFENGKEIFLSGRKISECGLS